MRISDWSSDVCSSDLFLPLKMAMSIVYASCLALTLRDAYGVAALAAWCGLVIAASIACHNALRSEELGGARGRAQVQSIWAATAVLAIPNLLWTIPAYRKSTRLNSTTNAHLVCRHLLGKKNHTKPIQ